MNEIILEHKWDLCDKSLFFKVPLYIVMLYTLSISKLIHDCGTRWDSSFCIVCGGGPVQTKAIASVSSLAGLGTPLYTHIRPKRSGLECSLTTTG